MKYGYARVSTLVQLKGNSLEDQRQKLREAGVPEENIVTEQYSGKTTSRPKFQELIAKLLGSMNAPISNTVNVLQGVIRNAVYVLDAIRAQKESA